jgi:hypothetical protein
MKDEYGMQRDQREVMKMKLRGLPDEQRRDTASVSKQVTTPAATVKLPERQELPEQQELPDHEKLHALPSTDEVREWSGPDQEPEHDEKPVETLNGVIFVTAPEARPDLYIPVHTPEMASYFSSGRWWDVSTGRVIISWRQRQPSDGDAPFVRGEPRLKHQVEPIKPPVDPTAKAQADRAAWLQSFLNGERHAQVLWAPGKVADPSSSDDRVHAGSFGGTSWRNRHCLPATDYTKRRYR